jgi:hypothetical protein
LEDDASTLDHDQLGTNSFAIVDPLRDLIADSLEAGGRELQVTRVGTVAGQQLRRHECESK